MPMKLRPYIDFSPQTPNRSTTAPVSSESSGIAEAVLVAEPVVALHAVLGDADDGGVRPPRSRRAAAVKSSASGCSPGVVLRIEVEHELARRGSPRARASPPPSRGRVKSGTGWPASIAAWRLLRGSAALRMTRRRAGGKAASVAALPRGPSPIPAGCRCASTTSTTHLPEELIALRPGAAAPGVAPAGRRPGDASTTRPSRGSATGWSPATSSCFNDTRVIPARLAGVRRRAAGGEGADRGDADRARRRTARWRALARPGKRLAVGDRIDFGAGLVGGGARQGRGRGRCSPSTATARRSRRRWTAVGEMPLPPYIAARRAADARDREDYQTVFAARPGAVAAPTASLHFDAALLAGARGAGGRATTRLTLHVGAGTFLPVKVEDDRRRTGCTPNGARSAPRRPRRCAAARAAGGRVIPVGTTALRLLETAATGPGRDRALDRARPTSSSARATPSASPTG